MKTVIEMAREAGLYDSDDILFWPNSIALERFASLITAQASKDILNKAAIEAEKQGCYMVAKAIAELPITEGLK